MDAWTRTSRGVSTFADHLIQSGHQRHIIIETGFVLILPQTLALEKLDII